MNNDSDEHIEFDNCKVTEAMGGGFYMVVNGDQKIRCKLRGKMKLHSVRVLVGDKVRACVSKYDLSHGYIVFRY